MNVKITPFKAEGAIDAPPSKSYAHRYIIAAFLSGKPCTIENVGCSDDVKATVSAVKSLGGDVTFCGGNVIVNGAKTVKQAVVNCGESGSTMRFLIPVAAIIRTDTDAPLV